MSDLTAVSLFAGIGGFDLALERAAVNVVAAVEIDPDCRGVLARHFPRTALFNDVTEITGDQLIAAGFVPGRGILAGGSPCQDFSIAGRRAGLGGARSGLFWHFMRLADELRPRWLLFENVPGMLSAVCSCPGDETCLDNRRAVRCGRWEKRDGKRVFLAHVTHVPEGGACPGGCMGLHGGAMGTVLGAVGKRWDGVAYRVLDAQFFGVPQRRGRVFIAGCLGDRAAPAEVLLESEGGDRDPAAGSQAGPGDAGGSSGGAGEPRTIGTLGTGGPGGGWRVGADEAAAGQLVASTLQGGGRRGHRIDAEGAAGGHLITAPTLTASWGTNHGAPGHGGKDDAIMAVSRAITGVQTATAVRRLTPLECERLMGLPDDWTRWQADGTEQSDSARYRQCGNAIAVPVAEWILQRLVAVDQCHSGRAPERMTSVA